jgi:hypothetical protein
MSDGSDSATLDQTRCAPVGGRTSAVQMNFTARVLPRCQTTSQGRPVLTSREKARRSLEGTAPGSLTSILAPLSDMSRTVHGRAAKLPSKTSQPGCWTDLRVLRVFGFRAKFI